MNFDVMHRIKNEVMLHREREAHGLGAFRHHAVQRAGVNRLRHAHFKNLNGLTLTDGEVTIELSPDGDSA